ncbi:MAG TPA: hypothetical protein VIX17_08005 [Pyrinomonadaceae bacterium]
MRTLICLIAIWFAVSVSWAQDHSQWHEFRSEADGFSIEMPGTPKISSRDLSDGQTQNSFTLEIGSETYMASVVQLNPGRVPANPDQAYFENLMKAYTEGSKTTLRSSRMVTWAGRTAMEGIADAQSATHIIDLTTAGDRIYLVVYAGAKAEGLLPPAMRLRDSFKLLGK